MKAKRTQLLGAMAALVVAQGAMSSTALFPTWKVNYGRGEVGAQAGLSPDQLIAVLAGFREMIAGILWVRADSFFDTGNFDAILPIIRLVTILDPKQIDVFATGMWHIGYNFTDEQSRSDRRYLPSAIALGTEGARNNPNTYEMFFETGWLWYHKIDDLPDRAVKWWEDAEKREDILPARRNILAMAYQRNGQPDRALNHYLAQLQRAEEAMKTNQDFQARQQRDTNEGNVDTTLIRMGQRGFFSNQPGMRPAGVLFDTDNPFDVGFSAQVKVVRPKVLRVRATWNVRPLGTRIRVVLRDIDFPNAIPAGAEWDKDAQVNLDPPKDQTFMQDSLFIRNRRADLEIDMSRDPTMYPFRSPRYVLEFYYNPRSAPPHIQDKFGWNGEGMTDKNFMNTEIRPGARVIYTRFEITREQILALGEWRDRPFSVQTSNWVETGNLRRNDEIIQTPNLLAPATPPPGGGSTAPLAVPMPERR